MIGIRGLNLQYDGVNSVVKYWLLLVEFLGFVSARMYWIFSNIFLV